MEKSLDELGRAAKNIFLNNQETTLLVLATLFVVCLLAWSLRELYHYRAMRYVQQYIPKPRHKALMRTRAQFVADLIAFDCQTAIEKRVYDQTLTRFEANQHYKKMGLKTGNRTWMPDPWSLKKLLKAKQKAKELHAPPQVPVVHTVSGGQVVAFSQKGRRHRRA